MLEILTPLGEDGIAEVHRVLSHTMGYSHDEVNEKIRAVAPHFMSCPKVRQRMPGICEHSECNCEFNLEEGSYPTPLLHAGLKPKLSGQLRRKQGIALPLGAGDGNNIDRLVEEYSSLRQKGQLLQEKLSDLQLLISDELKKSPERKVSTSIGTYSLEEGSQFQLKVKKVPLLEPSHYPKK